MAERTGLEPATPGVTGRYSNQLNYRSVCGWQPAGAPRWTDQAMFCRGRILPIAVLSFKPFPSALLLTLCGAQAGVPNG